MKGVHINAHMPFFVRFNIVDIVQWVPTQVFRAVQRGSPELELPQVLVENDGLNMASQEKAEGENEEKDDHQILPPVPKWSLEWSLTLASVLCKGLQSSPVPRYKEGK